MRSGKTIIVSEETLVLRGLVHLIHSIIPDTDIEIFKSIAKLISKNQGDHILFIIDPEKVEDSPVYNIQKCYDMYPQSCFIALSPNELPDSMQACFSAVISPEATEESIKQCLEKSFAAISEIRPEESSGTILSDREKEVLRGVALGHTNKEISENLFISAHTVITHRKNISAKLGIKTIAGLAVYSVLNGIISADEIESNS